MICGGINYKIMFILWILSFQSPIIGEKIENTQRSRHIIEENLSSVQATLNYKNASFIVCMSKI